MVKFVRTRGDVINIHSVYNYDFFVQAVILGGDGDWYRCIPILPHGHLIVVCVPETLISEVVCNTPVAGV